jgi:hypothetical protein
MQEVLSKKASNVVIAIRLVNANVSIGSVSLDMNVHFLSY